MFDELQTFNYSLTSEEIQRQYGTVISQDRDLNGTPDLLEDAVLPACRPFTGVPFAITGTIEAEQFDLGGLGIAYSNFVQNVSTNDYRPSGMDITNCNDNGLGYCVDYLRENDWLKFTIDVRVGQNYVVEPRLAGIGTNGGVFQVEFFTNGVSYANTGPLTVASTNWHEIQSPFVTLAQGTNVMKISFLTNAPDSQYVGKLNYVSIYPGFHPGVPNIITNITVSEFELSADETWHAATNNARLIQEALAKLPPSTDGGGSITIPSGRWFVAQQEPNEMAAYEPNGAVYVSRSNTEIRGEGPDKTNTTLITWFRSTSALLIGLANKDTPVAVTNFTLRDISFEGRPHNRATNSADGGFEPIWEGGGGVSQIGGEVGSLVTVASDVPSTAPFFTNLTQNLLVTNCLFRNPGAYSLAAPRRWSNALVTACEFRWRDTTFNPTNGTFPFPREPVTYPSLTTISHPSGEVGIFTRGGACYNTLVISNIMIGNAAISTVNTNFDLDVPDGLFWGQAGGNFFVARNCITNYGLEGVAINGMPSSVVNNQYKTLVSSYSTTALNGLAGATTLNGVINLQDNVIYFVGNTVDGGRHAELGLFHGDATRIYALHFSGNSVSLLPPFSRADDYPGAAVNAVAMAWANISGNKLLQGGVGVRWGDFCTNAIVMKNDFGAASLRSLAHEGADGQATSMHIIKNVLNHGRSYHLKLRHQDSSRYFLQKNTYTNNNGGTSVFLDAASSPVHIMH